MGLTFCGFTFGSVFRLVSNGYSSSSCNRDIFNNVICNLGGVAIEEIDSSGNLVKDRKSSRQLCFKSNVFTKQGYSWNEND